MRTEIRVRAKMAKIYALDGNGKDIFGYNVLSDSPSGAMPALSGRRGRSGNGRGRKQTRPSEVRRIIIQKPPRDIGL